MPPSGLVCWLSLGAPKSFRAFSSRDWYFVRIGPCTVYGCPFAPVIWVVLAAALAVVVADVPTLPEVEVAADEAGAAVELPASPDLCASHPAPTTAKAAIVTEAVAVRIAFARISIPLELFSPAIADPILDAISVRSRREGILTPDKRLVREVPCAGEVQRDAGLGRRLGHLVVAHRTSGMHDGLHTGGGQRLKS